LTTHPGVVTLDETEIQVSLALEPGRVRLFAGDREVGDWSEAECIIRTRGDGGWVIEAENESLPFQPEDPRLFSVGLNGPSTAAPPFEAIPEQSATGPLTFTGPREGPPPRWTTLLGFYLIAGFTAVLGVWAFLSLIT